jgi:hypothetical protein
MEICKGCGKTVDINEMTNDLCNECLHNNIAEKNDDIKTNEISFLDHLFKKNWIFYIIAGVIGICTALFEIYNSNTSDYTLLKGLYLILALIITFSFKNPSFFKKILMYFASSVLISLTAAISMFLVGFILHPNMNNKIIENILASNSQLPKKANEEVEIVKFTSDKPNEITQHMKFINYTKIEILSEYNNINVFENNMLQGELETSCRFSNVKEMLSSIKAFNITYYDKNNEIIGMIYIDDKKCKPYYTK